MLFNINLSMIFFFFFFFTINFTFSVLFHYPYKHLRDLNFNHVIIIVLYEKNIKTLFKILEGKIGHLCSNNFYVYSRRIKNKSGLTKLNNNKKTIGMQQSKTFFSDLHWLVSFCLFNL
jgi:hypothetical protein